MIFSLATKEQDFEIIRLYLKTCFPDTQFKNFSNVQDVVDAFNVVRRNVPENDIHVRILIELQEAFISFLSHRELARVRKKK